MFGSNLTISKVTAPCAFALFLCLGFSFLSAAEEKPKEDSSEAKEQVRILLAQFHAAEEERDKITKKAERNHPDYALAKQSVKESQDRINTVIWEDCRRWRDYLKENPNAQALEKRFNEAAVWFRSERILAILARPELEPLLKRVFIEWFDGMRKRKDKSIQEMFEWLELDPNEEDREKWWTQNKKFLEKCATENSK